MPVSVRAKTSSVGAGGMATLGKRAVALHWASQAKQLDVIAGVVAPHGVVAMLAIHFGGELRRIGAAFFPPVPQSPDVLQWLLLMEPKRVKDRSSTC